MTAWGTNNGWKCDLTKASWANSFWDKFAPIATTHSKGKPSYKSDASQSAEDMAEGSPAYGNPLQTINYDQSRKWGNPISGTDGKWPLNITSSTEKGAKYEGE